MKPIYHAKSSAKKFGGCVEDYLAIHQEMDISKSQIADSRHRAVFHTAFGCYIMERIFGVTITNSDGKEVCVRDIAEQHILEDFHGFIPTLQDFLEDMPVKDWMVNGKGQRPTSADTIQIMVIEGVPHYLKYNWGKTPVKEWVPLEEIHA